MTVTVVVRAARGLVNSKGAAPAQTSVSITLPSAAEPSASEAVESAEPTFNFAASEDYDTSDATLTTLVTTPVAVQLLEGAESLGVAYLSLEPLKISNQNTQDGYCTLLEEAF